MNLRIAFPVFLSLVLVAGVVPAGAEPPLRLTVEDAIRMALGGGTQSDLARSSEERARIARSEAFGALLPQADARLMRYNQSINLATFGFSLPGQPPVVGPFNVTDAQLSAAVQLFNFAALRRYEALRQEERASRYDTEQAENDVASAVARLYVMLERADAQIAARQADVTLFTTLGRVSQDELKAGTGTRLDVAQSNVQLLRSRQALLVAQNDREATRLALLNAIGVDEGTDLTLVAALATTTRTNPPALEPSLARAREQRPELKQAETRHREAELNVAAARARRLPSLGLDFEGDLSGNRTDDLHSTRRIAATASMPLYRADIQATIARAKLQLHDTETLLTQRRRDVEQDVRRSILALENAEARLALASENVLVAEEALTVSRDRRSSGYGSPIEVDRAQDTYRQAHEDLISAEADAVAAQFDFEHATGDIRRYVPAAGSSAHPDGGSAPVTPQTPSGVSSSTAAPALTVAPTPSPDTNATQPPLTPVGAPATTPGPVAQPAAPAPSAAQPVPPPPTEPSASPATPNPPGTGATGGTQR
jgi:outer membrane protein TolC